jgi:hypothetical protein
MIGSVVSISFVHFAFFVVKLSSMGYSPSYNCLTGRDLRRDETTEGGNVAPPPSGVSPGYPAEGGWATSVRLGLCGEPAGHFQFQDVQGEAAVFQ